MRRMWQTPTLIMVGAYGLGIDVDTSTPALGTLHYYSTSFGIPPWNASAWAHWYIADRTALAREYVACLLG